MQLKTFGGLSIVTAEGPAAGAATQRRRLCLLAVLAEAGNRGVTREKLLGLLWPESDEERGRASLAQALYALRRDLGSEDVIDGSASLRLNEALLPSDIAQFRQAITEGRFQQAVDLYAGPFLDGVYLAESPEFERWIEQTRGELATAAASAIEKAATRAADSGDHAGAVALWKRRVSLDPYDSAGALALMRALAAAGDRAAAVRHARLYESLVRDQLGLDPEPAVQQLAEELSRPAPAKAPRAASAPPAIPEPQPQLAMPSLSPPLRRRFVLTALGALLLAGGITGLSMLARPNDASPASGTVLAIGGFNAYGPDAGELARAASDLLSTSLARSPRVTVLSSARLFELQSRQGTPRPDSARAMLEAARDGGATEMIDGALYVQTAGVRLDLRRSDVTSGRVLMALSITAPDLFAAVDSGTRALLAVEGDSVHGSVADVTTSSLAAYRLYSAGLREFFAMRGTAAYPLFAAAIADDSLFAMAEYYAGLTSTDPVTRYRHMTNALRLASRASERERLLIQWSWASANDEPASWPLAESLVTRFAAEPFAHQARAMSLFAQARFAEVIPAARRAIALDRGAPAMVTPGRCIACEARSTLVSTYRMLDSSAVAEREARTFTREFPRRIEAWTSLSEQLLHDGKVAEAIEARREAVRLGEALDLDEWTAYTGLFSMDYAPLDAWFTRELRSANAHERNQAAWWLTLSYRAQGRLRDALETARILRSGNQTYGRRDAAPYEALSFAQTLAEMGRAREAAEVFDSIFRLRAPDITEARLARHRAWLLTHVASSRALAGDTAGLLALADSIEAFGRRSAYARDQRLHHHVRGLLYAARGAHAEAAESFRRAIYSPTVGYTRTNQHLARSLVRLGRHDEAAAWLRAALRGGAEGSNLYLPYPELHEELALTFSSAGRQDSARAHARIAARAWSRADQEFARRRAVMDSLSR